MPIWADKKDCKNALMTGLDNVLSQPIECSTAEAGDDQPREVVNL